MRAIFLIASILCAANAYPPESNCETNDDCSENSCCVAMSRFFIMSKRAQPKELKELKPILWKDPMAGGRCMPYIPQNASCHSTGFTSCGCEPGTKCKYYPQVKLFPKLLLQPPLPQEKTIPQRVGKRMIMRRPGKSFCESP